MLQQGYIKRPQLRFNFRIYLKSDLYTRTYICIHLVSFQRFPSLHCRLTCVLMPNLSGFSSPWISIWAFIVFCALFHDSWYFSNFRETLFFTHIPSISWKERFFSLFVFCLCQKEWPRIVYESSQTYRWNTTFKVLFTCRQVHRLLVLTLGILYCQNEWMTTCWNSFFYNCSLCSHSFA